MVGEMEYQEPSAQCIAFAYSKGGTGKTTACLNIAGWLQKMDNTVLVIDLDPKGNATSGLGVDLKTVEGSMYDVLYGNMRLQDILLETQAGIYCAAAPLSLNFSDNKAKEKSLNHLKNVLKTVKPYFNYILIDVPPGAEYLTQTGILAADHLMVPLDMGVFANETLEEFQKLINQLTAEFTKNIQIQMLVVKDFSNSIFDWKLKKKIQQYLNSFSKSIGMTTSQIHTIPFSRKVLEAQWQGMPISHYAPQSEVALAYRKIVDQIQNNAHLKVKPT